MSDHLFPHRLSRRDLLAAAAAAAVAPALSRADATESRAPVKIGQGAFTYTLDPDWGKLPAGMTYGYGCAIVVDSQDRVYVTSRSTKPCVAVFDRDGKLAETWSDDVKGRFDYNAEQVKATAHGLYWSKEPAGEFLYFTENQADKGKLGRRVYKTDLSGKILYQLGNVAGESSTSQKFQFDNPTDVAVAANGDIYIVDGYGSQLVHRFDKDFKHLKTIGGKGAQHGKFNTCHGVWVRTLGKEPEVYIADRANNRLEVYSLDLEYKRTVPGVRKPCCFYQHEGHVYVPELDARVSVFDENDKPVAHLGDGADIKPADREKHPDKFATPHALCTDSRGDLYVLEWLPHGRVRKFKRTPA